jgi:glycerophosphoryl diester phosphodiesterase
MLGMAMAISGAAANPNMGKATSSAAAFLLTAFNVRLGWWIGNTKKRDKATLPGPRLGLTYTAKELTGSTDDDSDFVNISDGGHFDNLGVYELIRRGCRYIIACDAGQDGRFTCEDLGDLVRRCRTDFGVEIDISVERIRDRHQTGWSKVHCVVGKIHYMNVPKRNWNGRLVTYEGHPVSPGDSPGHEVGYLIYLKPSITGDEPHDVLEYGDRVKAFPHESTADQWFNESQFESYRKLGIHIAEGAFARYQYDDRRPFDPARLFERLYKFWYPPSAAVGDHSTDQTQIYSAIMERVRKDPNLRFLDHTLFDGLFDDGKLSARDEFYVVNSLIQLMEDVYADLNLEEVWNHPHVEGWMAVFRRWAVQDAFRRAWAISCSTYAERFRNFYDDRLAQVNRNRRFLTLPRSFIAAHRGRVDTQNGGNSLADFDRAIEAGAEVIELDVRRLKDGTLVVFHDDRANGDLLKSMTYNQVRILPGQPEPVPTLSECLTALRGRVLLDIELKDEDTETGVLSEIRQNAWNPNDFVLTSFHETMPQAVRRMRYDVQVGLLIEAKDLPDRALKYKDSRDVDFIAPNGDLASLTDPLLEELAEAGMPVVPWTVNDQSRMVALLRHPAVAGIITDQLSLARSVRDGIR